jgi:hypothetical protein
MRVWIRDLFDPRSGIRNLFDPGSWIQDGNLRIRDKHPGSAILALSLPINFLATVPPPPPATELIKPVELAALTPATAAVLEAVTACCRLGLEVCRVEEFTLLMRLLSTLATLLSTAGSVRETTTFEYLLIKKNGWRNVRKLER